MARTVTISDLQYKLSLNAKDLDANAIASRTELNYTNRALRELRTPMERYEKDLRDAEQLLKFGEAGQELYNRRLAQAEKRLQDATGETKRLKEAQDRLNAETEQAARITDRHADKNEKLAAEMRDVNAMYRRGKIDARTYELEMERLNRSVSKSQTLFQALGSRIGSAFGLDGIIGSSASSVAGQVALITAGIEVANRFAQSVQRAGEFVVDRLRTDLEEIDKLAKSARALNLEINDLSGLQFAFGQGAGLTGDQTSKLLTEVTKRSSEAAQGLGESKLAFEELNLSAAELARLSPDEQLFRIADAMQDVELRSDRLRLSGKLFGEEQTRAFIAMDEGAEGLRAAIQRSEDLGLSLSTEDATKVEGLNDALDSLGQTLIGISRRLTVEAADDLNELVDSLEDMAISLLENKDVLLGAFDVAVLDNIQRFTDSIEGMNFILNESLENFQVLGKEAADFLREDFGIDFGIPGLETFFGMQEEAIQERSKISQGSSDPVSSIVAKSREAFNVEFRNETINQLQLAQQQLDATKTGVEAQQETARMVTMLNNKFQLAEAF